MSVSWHEGPHLSEGHHLQKPAHSVVELMALRSNATSGDPGRPSTSRRLSSPNDALKAEGELDLYDVREKENIWATEFVQKFSFHGRLDDFNMAMLYPSLCLLSCW